MGKGAIMFIRSPYNYDKQMVSLETGLECKDPSLTVQDQAEDVNDIVRQFGITGKIPSSMRIPQSGDFTGVGTYQECLQAVKEAQNEFKKLPASIRERFRHNPQNFIEFIENPKNAEEGEKLGIWKLKERTPEGVKGSARTDEGVTGQSPEAKQKQSSNT